MIVVSIKLAALGIAVAIISIFVYYYGFNNYVAIAGLPRTLSPKLYCGYHAQWGAGGSRRRSRSCRSCCARAI